MPNPFVPFGLKVRDIAGNSAVIEWDLDNTVEFKSGVYYNVYLSADGVSYTLSHKSNITYTTVPLQPAPFYVTITSVTPSSGESAQSTALLVTRTIGNSSSQDSTTVAITPTGEPVRLKTLPDGTVVVSLNSGTIGGTGSTATEAKQDALIAVLTALAGENHSDLAGLNTVITGLQEHIDDASLAHLLQSEATTSGVSSAGSIITLPWKKRSLIHKITVIKESGSASQWLVEILNTNVTPGEKNIVLRDASVNYSGTRMDLLQTVPFINVLDLDFIYVRLTPDAGSDNVFYLNISGEESK